MPNILAIETSTHACSVALHIGEQNHTITRYEVEPRVHTRILLPMIDSVLKEATLDVSQITAFAYGCGPGSFTGVRIASSVIQGLGFGAQKPVIAISSLRALAQQKVSAVNHNICAIIDARMNQVYWGLFKTNLQGIVEAYGNENLSSKQDILLPDDWLMYEGYPRAEELAMLAKLDYLQGKGIAADHALPTYLRNPF